MRRVGQWEEKMWGWKEVMKIMEVMEVLNKKNV